MTSPLREMAAAARRMADGDWSQRVTDTSADEVGELARAFNAMAAELAAVDRMRRDLVANVSHELRTPISALQARLENLVDGVEEPDPELLRSMLDQTERLGRLVSQLLDLSRLESGVVPLRRELRRRRLAARRRGGRGPAPLAGPPHRGRRRPDADLKLRADADRIHQVLANLTANALRFGPPDRPVRLAARRAGDGGRAHRARRGARHRARPTPTASSSASTGPTRPGPAASGGAGLGLSIARWIVELHDGQHPRRAEPAARLHDGRPARPNRDDADHAADR